MEIKLENQCIIFDTKKYKEIYMEVETFTSEKKEQNMQKTRYLLDEKEMERGLCLASIDCKDFTIQLYEELESLMPIKYETSTVKVIEHDRLIDFSNRSMIVITNIPSWHREHILVDSVQVLSDSAIFQINKTNFKDSVLDDMNLILRKRIDNHHTIHYTEGIKVNKSDIRIISDVIFVTIHFSTIVNNPTNHPKDISGIYDVFAELPTEGGIIQKDILVSEVQYLTNLKDSDHYKGINFYQNGTGALSLSVNLVNDYDIKIEINGEKITLSVDENNGYLKISSIVDNNLEVFSSIGENPSLITIEFDELTKVNDSLKLYMIKNGVYYELISDLKKYIKEYFLESEVVGSKEIEFSKSTLIDFSRKINYSLDNLKKESIIIDLSNDAKLKEMPLEEIERLVEDDIIESEEIEMTSEEVNTEVIEFICKKLVDLTDTEIEKSKKFFEKWCNEVEPAINYINNYGYLIFLVLPKNAKSKKFVVTNHIEKKMLDYLMKNLDAFKLVENVKLDNLF